MFKIIFKAAVIGSFLFSLTTIYAKDTKGTTTGSGSLSQMTCALGDTFRAVTSGRANHGILLSYSFGQNIHSFYSLNATCRNNQFYLSFNSDTEGMI